MNEIKSRKQSLEDKICEMEAALRELKAQLKRETESEQHMAIDKLEMYLGEIDSKYANLQDFWKVLREEILDLFSGNSRNDKEN